MNGTKTGMRIDDGRQFRHLRHALRVEMGAIDKNTRCGKGTHHPFPPRCEIAPAEATARKRILSVVGERDADRLPAADLFDIVVVQPGSIFQGQIQTFPSRCEKSANQSSYLRERSSAAVHGAYAGGSARKQRIVRLSPCRKKIVMKIRYHTIYNMSRA